MGGTELHLSDFWTYARTHVHCPHPLNHSERQRVLAPPSHTPTSHT